MEPASRVRRVPNPFGGDGASVTMSKANQPTRSKKPARAIQVLVYVNLIGFVLFAGDGFAPGAGRSSGTR
jgi:hypothetical protein